MVKDSQFSERGLVPPQCGCGDTSWQRPKEKGKKLNIIHRASFGEQPPFNNYIINFTMLVAQHKEQN